MMHAENDEDVPVAEAQRMFAAAQEPKTLWLVPQLRIVRLNKSRRMNTARASSIFSSKRFDKILDRQQQTTNRKNNRRSAVGRQPSTFYANPTIPSYRRQSNAQATAAQIEKF